MRAIQACCPVLTHFLEADHLKPQVDSYDLHFIALRMKGILAKHSLAKKALESTSAVFKELLPLKEAFLTLHKLVHIVLTICVSTASCKRSFSALKRIKMYWQSTIHGEAC